MQTWYISFVKQTFFWNIIFDSTTTGSPEDDKLETIAHENVEDDESKDAFYLITVFIYITDYICPPQFSA